MLLRLSKLTAELTKHAMDSMGGTSIASLTPKPPTVPGLPGGSSLGSALKDPKRIVNGLEGRFLKPKAGGTKVRKTEGPRAYAPRLSTPNT
jgi:hypothetical protein